MSIWISSENLIYDVLGVATADIQAREMGGKVQEKLVGCSVSRREREGQNEFLPLNPQTKARNY